MAPVAPVVVEQAPKIAPALTDEPFKATEPTAETKAIMGEANAIVEKYLSRKTKSETFPSPTKLAEFNDKARIILYIIIPNSHQAKRHFLGCSINGQRYVLKYNKHQMQSCFDILKTHQIPLQIQPVDEFHFRDGEAVRGERVLVCDVYEQVYKLLTTKPDSQRMLDADFA